ncbi:MAG: phytanoyl-CoA dioxygenase family protein [Pseudomonadota bacterium]
MLSERQQDDFHRYGYICLPGALTSDQVERAKTVFAEWVDQSRDHNSPFGEMIDGRKRFDLENGHSSKTPALRRVSSPEEVSTAYLSIVRESPAIEALADLIGPDIKFHHSKINAKLPGATTSVKFHQDFPFTPHSNDDLITVLYFLDDVTEENGALEVVPGSHRGPIHSLWQNGQFTGSVAAKTAAAAKAQATVCTGPAGSACLMHTRLLHGSAPNQSSNPRTLYIAVYSAADAVPLSPSPVPSRFCGELIRGTGGNTIRTTSFEMEMPELPTGASFFSQQSRTDSQSD